MTDVVVCSRQSSAQPIRMVCYVPTPHRPLRAEPGDRLYVVHDGGSWAWCTIAEVLPMENGVQLVLADAHRVSLRCNVRRFDGYRYRWWDRVAERYPPEDAHHRRTG